MKTAQITLTLSLIIPVYNEERHIRACLTAIQKQTVKPHEVIVVDNNCTDATVAIAKEFAFVTIISESKQGRAQARNAGFNSATGDIIGRIDGDSQPQPDWVARVVQHFSQDSNLMGLTGLGVTPLVPLLRYPRGTLFPRSYYWHVHAFFGTITMWGATMAIRRQAWHEVKNVAQSNDSQVHEDQDISLHMAGRGMKIAQKNDVRVISTNQSFRYLPKALRYTSLRNRTKKIHRKIGNLPVPDSVRISLVQRLSAHVFSIPAMAYGLLVGVILLPADLIATKVLKRTTWFD